MNISHPTAPTQSREQRPAWPIALPCAALLTLASGCASYIAHIDRGAPYGIYPGTRADMLIATRNWPDPRCALFVLDLPLSTALDTMLLPADVLGSGVEGVGLWAPLPSRTNEPPTAAPTARDEALPNK